MKFSHRATQQVRSSPVSVAQYGGAGEDGESQPGDRGGQWDQRADQGEGGGGGDAGGFGPDINKKEANIVMW